MIQRLAVIKFDLSLKGSKQALTHSYLLRYCRTQSKQANKLECFKLFTKPESCRSTQFDSLSKFDLRQLNLEVLYAVS